MHVFQKTSTILMYCIYVFDGHRPGFGYITIENCFPEFMHISMYV